MTVALLQNQQQALGREQNDKCAAPVQGSQNTPGSVGKCGKAQVSPSYGAPDVPSAKSPFWSWPAGPGRI